MRNADASASAAKGLHPNRQEPGGSDVHEEPRDPTPEDELPGDITAEQNGNNQDDVQDGDPNEAPPTNPALDPAHLATLISNTVDQKLKNFMPAQQSASSLQTVPLASALTPQPSTTRQLADPTLWRVYFHSRLRLQAPTFLYLRQHHHLLSLITFLQRPSKLFCAVSMLSLTYCCQKTRPF